LKKKGGNSNEGKTGGKTENFVQTNNKAFTPFGKVKNKKNTMEVLQESLWAADPHAPWYLNFWVT